MIRSKEFLLAELKTYGARLVPGAAEFLAGLWGGNWQLPDGPATAREVARRLADPNALWGRWLDPDAPKPASKNPLRVRLAQLVESGVIKADAVEPIMTEFAADRIPPADAVEAAGAVAAVLSQPRSVRFLTNPPAPSESEVRLRGVIADRFPANVRPDATDALIQSLRTRGFGYKSEPEVVREIARTLAGAGAVFYGDGERLRPDDARLREPLGVPEPAGTGTGAARF